MTTPQTTPGTDLVWHRMHPITPVVKGWKVLAVLLVVAWQWGGTSLREAQAVLAEAGWPVLVAVVAGALAIGFAYAAVAWRMSRYAVDAEAIHLQTGVLFRQQRAARLDRVQGIDVVQPLLARLFGLAELRVEVAGGADSAVRLAFLRDAQAQQLRNALLARAAGVEFGTAEQPEAPEAPERELVVVRPGRLIGSLARSSAIIVLVLGLGGMVAVAIATRSVAVLLSAVPGLLGAAGYLWQRFVGEFGFRVAQSPDGIRLRHGLLEQRTQTLPPGRVQAVRLHQPLLWRGRDWWRVDVNVAGYALTQEQGSRTVLLPVGDRAEALLALWLVMPDLGVAEPRAVLDAALSGTGDDDGFVTSPAQARWLDPWSWRRNGFVVTDRALIVRTGWLWRQVVVVPHERTQSLGLTQGPLQRRMGLATVALHSTPGPVVPQVHHLAADVAGGLVGAQAARARLARAGAGPELWMRAVAPVGPPVPVPGPPPPPPTGSPVPGPPPPPPGVG